MSSSSSNAGDASLHVFPSTAALASDLRARLTTLASEALAARQAFHVAVSGGSLPATLAQALLESPAVDTSGWHWWFADERCVMHGDKDSNFAETKKQLFDKLPAIPADHMHAIDEALVGKPAEAAAAYEAELQRVAGGALDVVLLGMGPDGHTCSLFPGHALLQESGKLVAPITDSPKPPPQRITLTFPALAKARAALFVCTGAGKADALSTVVRQRKAGGKASAEDKEGVLPSALVKAAGAGGVVFLVDQDAAAKLTSNL